MSDLKKNEIPKQVKVEILMEIDRNAWVAKIAEGYDPNTLLKNAAESLVIIAARPSLDIFMDHDKPVIKDIKIEEEN